MRKHEELSNVQKKEWEKLKERRKKAGLKEGNPEKDAVGMALSGGMFLIFLLCSHFSATFSWRAHFLPGSCFPD